MSATKEIVEIAPRRALPLLAVGSAARDPSTALRAVPLPREAGRTASSTSAPRRRRNAPC